MRVKHTNKYARISVSRGNSVMKHSEVESQ
jgi:hypothetical protein